MEKFHELRSDRVINTFQLTKHRHSEQLTQWLDYSTQLSSSEQMLLQIALDRYERLSDGWNEEELKMHFISLIFAVADVNINHVCKTFYERPLSAAVDNKWLNVVCDAMIAQPDLAGLPTKPYFFLQEFKQAQRFGKTDPEGQMLAAMLVSQQLYDSEQQIIYGSFIIERHWYFATLQQRHYCVSPAFDATVYSELERIVFALKSLKNIIAHIQ